MSIKRYLGKAVAVVSTAVVALSASVHAAYTANYTISDLPTIIVDTIGKFIVAFQPNIQNVTDLMVLGLVLALIGSALIGLVTIVASVWGKMGGKRGKKHLG
jgi:hypothetical protein